MCALALKTKVLSCKMPIRVVLICFKFDFEFEIMQIQARVAQAPRFFSRRIDNRSQLQLDLGGQQGQPGDESQNTK